MREILFRGKRSDNGEWVEGSLWVQIDKSYILTLASSRGLEVDPDTVGQYTGLTDKNGKKIFEGDIVLDADEPCMIAYENGCWKEIFQSDWWSFIYDDDEVEIIGNIHDNPELLKGGEE